MIPSAYSPYLSFIYFLWENVCHSLALPFELFKNNRNTADCVCLITQGCFLLPLLLLTLLIATALLARVHSFPSPLRRGGRGPAKGRGRHVSTGGRPSAAAGVCWSRAPRHGCALSRLYGHDHVDLRAIVGTWWVRSYFDGSLRMLYVGRNAARRNKTAKVECLKTFRETRRTSATNKITRTFLVTMTIVFQSPIVQKGACS